MQQLVFVHVVDDEVEACHCAQYVIDIMKLRIPKHTSISQETLSKVESCTTPVFPQEVPTKDKPGFDDRKLLFPCFLAVGGSNGGIMVINEDGTFDIVSFINRCGRLMIGLGSMLSGCKSFEDLVELAEKGNMHNVHEYLSDISSSIVKDDRDNYYSDANKSCHQQDEDPKFLYGKCQFKDIDDFAPEDLALSHLFYSVTDQINIIQKPLDAYPKVKHVFFCGGLSNSPLMRKLILSQWMRDEACNYALRRTRDLVDTHFLKHGQYLVVIGAYLNHTLKYDVDESDN